MTPTQLIKQLHTWLQQQEDLHDTQAQKENENKNPYKEGKHTGQAHMAFRVQRWIEAHQNPNNPIVPRNKLIEETQEKKKPKKKKTP